jgi:hypothetical protein
VLTQEAEISVGLNWCEHVGVVTLIAPQFVQ